MKAIIVALAVLLISSCSVKNNIPQDILSQPRMQEVLWDVLRTDEFVLTYVKNDSTHHSKDESTRLYEKIFEVHKTNRDQFKKSVIFYTTHPNLLKVILDSLENRKSVVMQEIHRKPVIPDSARKKLRLNLPRK